MTSLFHPLPHPGTWHVVDWEFINLTLFRAYGCGLAVLAGWVGVQVVNAVVEP